MGYWRLGSVRPLHLATDGLHIIQEPIAITTSQVFQDESRRLRMCAGKRAMLVWGRAQDTQAEIDDLLQPEDWTYHIGKFPEPCRLRASVWALQIVLHGALDCHRRIVLPLLKFPH